MKLDRDGGDILYSTYITGNYKDYATDMAIDSNGDIWITGNTYSTDFPVTPNALNLTYTNISGYNFVSDGFLCKVSGADGSLQYSSYIGGDKVVLRAIAIDTNGYIWITGITDSNRFPITSNAVDNKFSGGGYDGFVCEFSSDGERLLFSTFLGGSGDDNPMDIAVDNEGDVWVTGSTSSGAHSGFPITTSALDSTINSLQDIFIYELNTEVRRFPVVSYCSYLGGSSDTEYGKNILIDNRGSIWVIGYTESPDFPTVNALDDTYGGGKDIIIYKMKVKGLLAVLENSTYIGGSGSEYGYSAIFDNEWNLWITGRTYSEDFPMVGAFDDTFDDSNSASNWDAYVLRLSRVVEIKYSTFLGGPDDDVGYGLGYDGLNDRIWVTGEAQVGFPIIDGYDDEFKAFSDIFVAYFGPPELPTPPRDLSGLLSLDSKILLIWGIPENSEDSPIYLYKVYRGLTEAGLVHLGDSTGLSYIDDDITINTTYYYVITAVNGVGESEHSNTFMMEIPYIDIGNLTNLLNTSLPESTPFPSIIFGISVLGILVVLRRQTS